MKDLSKVTDDHKNQMIEQSKYFQALANPVRLCLIHKLIENDELCVTDFCNCMGASQPLISKHLHKLKDSGILESSTKGQYVCYRLADDKAKEIVNILTEDKGGESK